ncbi:21728_t:CDS:2 [Gigaspora margarita]|uniref:DNA 3'-5' helicase n=1 Tax=Gigaspora margarita TaxID=4874 RepID=A0ABM8VVA7_GIGMA|nr:21728_t:CDS:2 [Gigaspora margarita]
MDYLQDLNPQQKQAVLEQHPRVCVIAGPGCGKTKTLVSKAIYLLASQQAHPQNILILTFAKKAIKEIKKRIFDQLDFVTKKDLHIYNFHSFCFHVLSRHSYLLGFPASRFPVYDRHEQEEVKRYEIYQKYQEYLQANKALDFNDLLIYTIRLFCQHPAVREEYQRQFTHILLDEFQDINATQNHPNLVNNLLTSVHPSGVKVFRLSQISVRFVVRQVLYLLSQGGIQFSDIAILYRNNYLSARLEQELTDQKIPYEILGAFKFIEREEIKDALAFLRSVLYQDNLSLLRILGLQEKIGIRTIEKIELNSQQEKKSVYDYLNDDNYA